MKKFLFAALLIFSFNQVALAEQLIAHVCWMGNECIKEYLISSVRNNDKVVVSVRDDAVNDGKISGTKSEKLTISCKVKPPYDHNHAVEYTRWMFACKGQKTEWSPK